MSFQLRRVVALCFWIWNSNLFFNVCVFFCFSFFLPVQWELLWSLILLLTFCLLLVWFYFWWEAHNDYSEFNWWVCSQSERIFANSLGSSGRHSPASVTLFFVFFYFFGRKQIRLVHSSAFSDFPKRPFNPPSAFNLSVNHPDYCVVTDGSSPTSYFVKE